MMIDPEIGSIKRNNAKVSEDLPAPVLPTIPTYDQNPMHVLSNNTNLMYNENLTIQFN